VRFEAADLPRGAELGGVEWREGARPPVGANLAPAEWPLWIVRRARGLAWGMLRPTRVSRHQPHRLALAILAVESVYIVALAIAIPIGRAVGGVTLGLGPY
jgi:hypothetical protein